MMRIERADIAANSGISRNSKEAKDQAKVERLGGYASERGGSA